MRKSAFAPRLQTLAAPAARTSMLGLPPARGGCAAPRRARARPVAVQADGLRVERYPFAAHRLHALLAHHRERAIENLRSRRRAARPAPCAAPASRRRGSRGWQTLPRSRRCPRAARGCHGPAVREPEDRDSDGSKSCTAENDRVGDFRTAARGLVVGAPCGFVRDAPAFGLRDRR